MRTIVVGTRQSALALTQTGQVIEQLNRICESYAIECKFEIRKIVTKGDRILDVTLSKVGGKGLFVKEIEQALTDGEIDLAVHSLKDMPAQRQDGLTIGAVPEREDARDCVITRDGKGLRHLPAGAKVGTSSLRRACQLKTYRPDLEIVPVRGNIDSRLRKLETEGFAAIVLAAAGLHRMGWAERISEYLQPDVCLPAVGQGALGLECRSDDTFVLDLLGKIHHEPTALAVTAERAFLARLGGSCQVPIGAHAVLPGLSGGGDDAAAARAAGAEAGGPGLPADAGRPTSVRLTGMVGAPDGSRVVGETMTGTEPERLGRALAEALIAQGADRLLAEALGG